MNFLEIDNTKKKMITNKKEHDKELKILTSEPPIKGTRNVGIMTAVPKDKM